MSEVLPCIGSSSPASFSRCNWLRRTLINKPTGQKNTFFSTAGRAWCAACALNPLRRARRDDRRVLRASRFACDGCTTDPVQCAPSSPKSAEGLQAAQRLAQCLTASHLDDIGRLGEVFLEVVHPEHDVQLL